MKLMIKTYYSDEKCDYTLTLYLTLIPNNYNYINLKIKIYFSST